MTGETIMRPIPELISRRADFPILRRQVNGRPLIYLDNAATTQKPEAVIEAVANYYRSDNANIHRGVHTLSQRATDAFEAARLRVRRFLNAADPSEIIFVRGATEAANLVAGSWVRHNVAAGETILISAMEHHSGIVPWQLACEATGARLKVIPMTDHGELDLEAAEAIFREGGVRLLACVHVSNSLGTVNDIASLVRLARAHDALVFVDGAQHVAHARTDVRALGVDFYAFSGHKLFGPTGIGVLYGRRTILDAMPPWQGGGDMIRTVRFERSSYAEPPSRFEAGTPDIAGAIGLGAAIDYVESIGLDRIEAYESRLYGYAVDRLSSVSGLRIIGSAPRRAGAISFVVERPPMAAHDLATLLDIRGIAVRSGHHCTMPVMERLGVPATARASIAFYNTPDEIDALVEAVEQIIAEHSTGVDSVEKMPAASGENAGRVESVRFPEPGADSVEHAAAELIETFDFLPDSEQKQQFLMDLGRQIPPMPQQFKNEHTRVEGCASVVHLLARCRDGRLDFLADSDAFIVRGLIGLLQKLFSGQKVEEILAFDVEPLFRRLGLHQHITTQRRNGLSAMVAQVRESARRARDPR